MQGGQGAGNGRERTLTLKSEPRSECITPAKLMPMNRAQARDRPKLNNTLERPRQNGHLQGLRLQKCTQNNCQRLDEQRLTFAFIL